MKIVAGTLKGHTRIALTGHRPTKIGGYNNNSPKNQHLSSILEEFIRNQLEESVQVTIISGMALGADTLWALTALKLKEEYPDGSVKLLCAIPCLDHASKWFGDSEQIYNQILSKADEVVNVTDSPYDYACMQLRNEYMVDKCDLLVSVWDGTKGGTANCVKYAEKVDKEIINIHPNTLLG